MKKLVKYSFLLLFCILVSCKKDCPPFNRDLLCWIPYSLGDTLKFINNRNDTISFGVYEKIIIDDNKKYGPCDKCGCWSEAFFYANSLQNSENTFYEGIVYVSATEIYFHISLNFNNRRGDFNLTTHHINENVIPSMIVDNQEYNDVIIFDNDTINDPNYSGFWRVIISKDIGFVKFYEKGSKNSWTRIN
jgi:hypothetical protein